MNATCLFKWRIGEWQEDALTVAISALTATNLLLIRHAIRVVG